jgi:hypothetical protein
MDEHQQQHQRRRPRRQRPFVVGVAPPTALLLLSILALLTAPSQAIKLKFATEECMVYTFNQYEYFYGSYVAMLPKSASGSAAAKYDLHVTAPSGQSLYEVTGESEATFHLVPVETGAHKFCLKFNSPKSAAAGVAGAGGAASHLPGHHPPVREVLWNVNVGYAEGHDKVEETDTQYLWHHVYQIDGQVQELKSTLHYLYWRERRHRQTVDSTLTRTTRYALLRFAGTLLAGAGQVLLIRRMFTKK